MITPEERAEMAAADALIDAEQRRKWREEYYSHRKYGPAEREKKRLYYIRTRDARREQARAYYQQHREEIKARNLAAYYRKKAAAGV